MITSTACAALKAETGAMVCGFARDAVTPSRIALENSPSGSYFVDYDFAPDRRVAGGDVIDGGDWAVTAIHTPGHAPDHLCFALEGRDVVFSGDHVMAWNTSVVAPPEGRMADYIASLEILLDRKDSVFLPGHGGRLEDPQRTVKAYLLHRRWREQAMLKALKTARHRFAQSCLRSIRASTRNLFLRQRFPCWLTSSTWSRRVWFRAPGR